VAHRVSMGLNTALLYVERVPKRPAPSQIPVNVLVLHRFTTRQGLRTGGGCWEAGRRPTGRILLDSSKRRICGFPARRGCEQQAFRFRFLPTITSEARVYAILHRLVKQPLHGSDVCLLAPKPLGPMRDGLGLLIELLSPPRRFVASLLSLKRSASVSSRPELLLDKPRATDVAAPPRRRQVRCFLGHKAKQTKVQSGSSFSRC
jgi:hypothetical protein